MATILTSQGKRREVSIEQKARALTVFSNHPGLRPNELGVQSGSRPDSAYPVEHDGKRATGCPCDAYGRRCAHRIAVTWYLEARARAAYVEAFSPCTIPGLY